MAKVMEAHLRKSHPEIKMGATIEVGTTGATIESPQITPEAASTDSKDELIAELKAQIEVLETKPATVPTHSEFDWNKIEKCMSCGEIHPAMLMVYHAHITHGV